MAENDIPEESPLLTRIRKLLASKDAGLSSDVNDVAKADTVDASSEPAKNFSTGGMVEDNKMDEESNKKLAAIYKAMRTPKMAPGGLVPDPATLGPTAPPTDGPQPPSTSDPSYWDTIKAALSQVAAPITKPISALTSGVEAASHAVEPLAPAVVNAANQSLGLKLPLPNAPVAPALPAAPAANMPAPVSTPAAPASMAGKAPAASPAGPNPLDQLGKFDPNSVAPGLNPSDRQALAGNLDARQHTFGNYLAEAVGGLGDAMAAKGGVQQNSLGDIFALQTQQRHEALENFDKARQAAVEHFKMKNDADQALIGNLKARGELQVAPGIAQAIGHPELAGKPVQQAELVIKADGMKNDFRNHMMERKASALKDAADMVEKANAHGGFGGTQKWTDPQAQLRAIHSQAIKNDPEAFGYSIQQAH